MNHLLLKPQFRLVLLYIALAELLSFLGWYHPVINRSAFAGILLLTLWFGLRRLETALWVVLIELIIGAKGYLFSWPLGGATISIRLGLFGVLIVCWLWWVWREKRLAIRQSQTWRWYLAWLAMIALGVLVAILRGVPQSAIFFDANGYLYFGLAPVFFHVWRSAESRQRFWTIFWAGIVALSLKTLVLLLLFASQVNILPELYRWVRDTRVYEITQQKFNFYRIFSQSQIFALAGFILSAIPVSIAWVERKKIALSSMALVVITSLTVVLSLSRSLWLALGIVLCVWLVVLIRSYHLTARRLTTYLSIATLIVIGEIGLLYCLVNSPNWLRSSRTTISLSSLVEERVSSTSQAGLQSRWNLIEPMWETIRARPVAGSGFGQSVSYVSSDPRVVAETGGRFNTYSFEWGYLDLWLKVGLIGLLVYLIYLWKIARTGLAALRQSPTANRSLTLAWLLVLLGLVSVHLTTPYLNHPLGIGLLLLIAVAFESFLSPNESTST